MKDFVKIGRHKVGVKSIIIWTTIALAVVAIISILIFATYYLSGNWAWIAGVGVFGLLVYMLIRYVRRQGTKKIFEKYGTDMTVVGFSLFGIIALNYLVYYLTTAQPKIWQWYWGNQAFFWSWNIGWCIVVFLSSKKDENGNTIRTANTIKWWVLIFMFLGFSVNLFYYKLNPTETTRDKISSTSPATTLSYGVPTEIALQVIAECESGGKQFEPNGKTPLKNKGIPQKNIPPSSAFGKYQFLEVHREPAKKLGHDLNTEEGQDEYARYRFERYGMKDWDFDEEHGGGSACWGPKLAKFGTIPQSNPDLLGVVDVPTSEWSDVVVNASLGKISWGRLDTATGGTCEVMLDGNIQKIFPLKEYHSEITPRAVQFRCSESGAKVRVRKVPNT